MRGLRGGAGLLAEQAGNHDDSAWQGWQRVEQRRVYGNVKQVEPDDGDGHAMAQPQILCVALCRLGPACTKDQRAALGGKGARDGPADV
jgi:hypothetical protein